MSDITILIIDDNNSNTLVLEQLIRALNIPVISLTSVTQLHSKLDEVANIGIVFLDVHFPNGSGYDCLEIIRSHPSSTSAKVIAYTVDHGAISKIRRSGFDGFLGKPIEAELFPEQIKRILNGEEVWYIP